MARALKVVGLMNVQFAIQGDEATTRVVYVLEVNPRASRTVPFVSKATGQPLAKIAARCMVGQKLAERSIDGVRGEVIPPYFSRQGSGLPVQQVPRRRPDPRPRDALDRRGHGRRPHLRRGDAEEPARRRLAPADARARSASRSRTATSRARSRSPATCIDARLPARRDARAPRRRSPRPAFRCAPSTRSRTAGRTSSTW